MTTLFISDLHLQESQAAITQGLFKLLDQYQGQCKALYILGDLFEAWVGDDDNTPFHQSIIAAFKTFNDAGSHIYLMHGNRDFLLGEDFCRAAGMELLQDPTVIDLYGTPVLLMHGDSLCTDDAAYQQFRQQIRQPEAIADLLSKSLEERHAIAQNLRKMSKDANSNKAEDIMDVNQQAVEETLASHGIKRLIHGHTHRPHHHRLNLETDPAERIVLGDWRVDHSWIIKAENNSLKLEIFEY